MDSLIKAKIQLTKHLSTKELKQRLTAMGVSFNIITQYNRTRLVNLYFNCVANKKTRSYISNKLDNEIQEGIISESFLNSINNSNIKKSLDMTTRKVRFKEPFHSQTPQKNNSNNKEAQSSNTKSFVAMELEYEDLNHEFNSPVPVPVIFEKETSKFIISNKKSLRDSKKSSHKSSFHYKIRLENDNVNSNKSKNNDMVKRKASKKSKKSKSKKSLESNISFKTSNKKVLNDNENYNNNMNNFNQTTSVQKNNQNETITPMKIDNHKAFNFVDNTVASVFLATEGDFKFTVNRSNLKNHPFNKHTEERALNFTSNNNNNNHYSYNKGSYWNKSVSIDGSGYKITSYTRNSPQKIVKKFNFDDDISKNKIISNISTTNQEKAVKKTRQVYFAKPEKQDKAEEERILKMANKLRNSSSNYSTWIIEDDESEKFSKHILERHKSSTNIDSESNNNCNKTDADKNNLDENGIITANAVQSTNDNNKNPLFFDFGSNQQELNLLQWRLITYASMLLFVVLILVMKRY